MTDHQRASATRLLAGWHAGGTVVCVSPGRGTELPSLVLGNALVLWLVPLGLYKYLTPDNPVTYVVLAALNVFALASLPMRWVRVEYTDGDGQPRQVFLTLASPRERTIRGAKAVRDLRRGVGYTQRQSPRLRK